MLYISRTLSEKRILHNSVELKESSRIDGISSFFVILAFGSMFLISGLRFNVGTDYYEYENLFYNIATQDIKLFGFKIEPVFVVISKIIAIFSKDSVWMFIITSFFIAYFIFKASIKSCRLYDLAIFLFISFGFYTSSLNIVRQWMAASVLLYGYTFLTNKQDKVFLKYVLLAYCCHYSAVVVLPVYLFIRKPRKNITRISVMIFGIFLFNSTNYIIRVLEFISFNVGFLSKYYKYLRIDENIGGNIFVLPMFCVLTYLLYMLFKGNNEENAYSIEINMNIISIGFVFSLIGQKLMTFSRLQFFFVSILIIIIPQIMYLLKKKERSLLYLLCIFMGTIFLVYSLINNGGQPLPYQTIFS